MAACCYRAGSTSGMSMAKSLLRINRRLRKSQSNVPSSSLIASLPLPDRSSSVELIQAVGNSSIACLQVFVPTKIRTYSYRTMITRLFRLWMDSTDMSWNDSRLQCFSNEAMLESSESSNSLRNFCHLPGEGVCYDSGVGELSQNSRPLSRSVNRTILESIHLTPSSDPANLTPT